MNDNIGPNLRNGHGITDWTNDTAEQVNRKNALHSNDFNVVKTTHGWRLQLKDRHKFLYEHQYKQEFTASAHYDVGDVVRVLSGSDYGVPASEGTWVCVVNVPDDNFSDAVIAAGLIGIYSDANKYYYIRDPDTDYFPKDPEPDTLAKITGHVSDLDGRYWERIGGGGNRIRMAVCVNGVEQFYLVDAIPDSGSGG
jgi:hypothetical protein